MQHSTTPSSSLPAEPRLQTKTWNDGYSTASCTPSSTPADAAAAQPSSGPSRSQNDVTISDAWNSIQPSDFLAVHQTPCARQGFLTGIGGGAAVGVLRFVMGAPVFKATNWAVGLGVVASLTQYEFCQFQRRQEKAKMARFVEVYNKNQAEAKAKEAEERQRKAREAEEAEAARRRKSWYRFW